MGDSPETGSTPAACGLSGYSRLDSEATLAVPGNAVLDANSKLTGKPGVF